MSLVILGSLALYAASASAFLWLARRFVAPVRLRAGLVLAACPLLFTGKALFTGGVYAPVDIAFDAAPLSAYREELGVGKTRNRLIIDIASQMIPWRQAVRESVENGRLPLWNRFLLGGEPLLGVAQPAVFHPGTWLGFLLPLPQAWTFDMTLRIFLSALCAYLFFFGTGASEAAALLGALGWAFADALLFFVGYPVTPSVAPLPLLLLALWRLCGGGGLAAAALMTAALVLMAIAGHPETLLFAVTGAGVYFLFLLAWAGRGRRRSAILWSLAAGALAFGLSAIAILPFLEALPQTHQAGVRTSIAPADRSDRPIESLRRLVSNAVPYAYGALGDSEVVPRFAVPVGYAGSLMFPLIATGLCAAGRRKWPWLALGALGLALSARAWGVTDVVARLPLFDIAALEYFVFLAIFAAVALAVEGADRLREETGVGMFLAASVACAGGLILFAISRQEILDSLGMRPEYLRLRVLAQVAPLLLGALLVVLARRQGRRWGAGVLTALLVLFAAQRVVEESGVYPTIPARAFYPPLPVLDPIPRGEPVRMTGLQWTLIPNVSALYGLEDVRGYEPMLFGPLAETFRLWSQPMPAFYNRIGNATAPFLAFLNVRYVLAGPSDPAPAGWPRVAEDRGSRLYENPLVLPRAFVPRHLVWTDLLGLHTRIMQRIGDYANDGVAGRARPGRLHWETNGPADVRIESYVAERVRLATEARAETLIGTSIPNWSGWKLTIDGKPEPLIPFNRAFVSFLVPPGRHRAELRYLPDGFVWGAALTGSSLALCVLLAMGARHVRTRPRA